MDGNAASVRPLLSIIAIVIKKFKYYVLTVYKCSWLKSLFSYCPCAGRTACPVWVCILCVRCNSDSNNPHQYRTSSHPEPLACSLWRQTTASSALLVPYLPLTRTLSLSHHIIVKKHTPFLAVWFSWHVLEQIKPCACSQHLQQKIHHPWRAFTLYFIFLERFTVSHGGLVWFYGPLIALGMVFVRIKKHCHSWFLVSLCGYGERGWTDIVFR